MQATALQRKHDVGKSN